MTATGKLRGYLRGMTPKQIRAQHKRDWRKSLKLPPMSTPMGGQPKGKKQKPAM